MLPLQQYDTRRGYVIWIVMSDNLIKRRRTVGNILSIQILFTNQVVDLLGTPIIMIYEKKIQ